MPAKITTKTGVQKESTRFEARFSMETIAFMSTSSAQIGFFVVELEVDQRAQHLQIGHQCVELGRIATPAVEVADKRLRIALLKCFGLRAVGIELGLEVGRGVGDLL